MRFPGTETLRDYDVLPTELTPAVSRRSKEYTPHLAQPPTWDPPYWT